MQKASLTLLAILGCAGCGGTAPPALAPSSSPSSTRPGAPRRLDVGEQWPTFELTNLTDRARIDTRGKVVFIHMFATWDGQGRALVGLQRLQRMHAARGFSVVAFSCDDDSPTVEADVLAYATKFGANYPVAFDREHRLTDLIHPSNEPSSWLVDRNGVVRYIDGGYRDGREADWEREVVKVLDNR